MADDKKSGKKLKAVLFEVKEGTLSRKNKACPKCGSGIYLAAHKDRQSCGKCGFTEWSRGE